MNKRFKKWIALGIAAALTWPVMGNTVQAATLAVMSETTESSIVTSGLTYEKISKLTNLGWVDIYVLQMDLNNDNVDLDIIRSTDAWGEKEALTSIMGVNQSIAAINATFFDMSGSTAESIGPEYEDGQFSYLQHNYNTSTLGAASLMLTEENAIDIGFFGAQISFTSDEGNSIYISAINSLTNFTNPVIINGNAMLTTAQIESKGDFYKMVIKDDTVIGYVNPKVAADIPDNGYVVTLEASTALNYTALFPLGTHVNLGVNSLTTGSLYNMIISGGGTILKNNQVVKEGLIIDAEKRHPRTALGVTEDKNYLIAMVVDGRGESIGATHNELAMYLQEYGVTDAIYMDGGGSSTMATRMLGTEYITLDNVPSDGAQRKVVNGLGFVSKAPQGQLTELKITPEETWISKDMAAEFTVVGYDEYYNPVQWSAKDLVWSSAGIEGTWEGASFTPTTAGDGTVTCSYEGVTATIPVHVVDSFIDLDADETLYHADLGGTAIIEVTGTSPDGYQIPINSKNLTYTVENPKIGFIEEGIFYARQQKGATKVTISTGDNVIETLVTVGTDMVTGTSFEDIQVSAAVYPSTVLGSAIIATGMHYDGAKSVQLNYSFEPSDETQAVYAVLDGIKFDKSVLKFGMAVYGNNNNFKFKAKLVDAENNTFYATLSDSIDFTGWKYLETEMPKGMIYPVRLERVYTATLAHDEKLDGSVYFDMLTMRKTADISGLAMNVDVPELDSMRISGVDEATYKVSLFGSTFGKNTMLDDLIINKVMAKTGDVDLAIFAGLSDVDIDKSKSESSILWTNSYKSYSYEDLKVINLSTNAGGVADSDYTQWRKLMDELNATGQKNIIIVGNRNPLNSGDFNDEKEAALLIKDLGDYQKKYGKNIYYINASGSAFSVDNYEGIRYMDVNGLSLNAGSSTLDLNNAFYLLQFSMVDGVLYYDYENLYPGDL